MSTSLKIIDFEIEIKPFLMLPQTIHAKLSCSFFKKLLIISWTVFLKVIIESVSTIIKVVPKVITYPAKLLGAFEHKEQPFFLDNILSNLSLEKTLWDLATFTFHHSSLKWLSEMHSIQLQSFQRYIRIHPLMLFSVRATVWLKVSNVVTWSACYFLVGIAYVRL